MDKVDQLLYWIIAYNNLQLAEDSKTLPKEKKEDSKEEEKPEEEIGPIIEMDFNIDYEPSLAFWIEEARKKNGNNIPK